MQNPVSQGRKCAVSQLPKYPPNSLTSTLHRVSSLPLFASMPTDLDFIQVQHDAVVKSSDLITKGHAKIGDTMLGVLHHDIVPPCYVNEVTVARMPHLS